MSGGLTFSNNSKTTMGKASTLSLQHDLSKAIYVYVNYSTFDVASNEGFAANDAAGLAVGKSLLTAGVAHSF